LFSAVTCILSGKLYSMRKISLSVLLVGLATILFSQEKRLILQSVNIIDVEKGGVQRNQAVIIQGDRITDILPAARYQQQANDSIVNCNDQYLIPGLWDMHTHVWMAEYYFPLFTANGITGHRGMLETMMLVNQWRKQASTPGTLVPTGFYAGSILDGPKPLWPNSIAVDSPEKGRRAVDSLKNKLKVDFLKVYSGLSRESYYAIADEAKKQGIIFAGHVPTSMTLLECIRAGQKTTEHMMGFIEAASDSSEYYYNVMRGNITDTSLRNNRTYRRAFLHRTFNEKNIQAVVNELRKNDSWVCPTMTVLRGIAYIKDTAFRNDPRLQYTIPMIRNMWNPANDTRFKNLPDDYFENEKKEFELNKRIVGLLHKGGVKLLAGTDTPNPFCFPGFSLHDELQNFVDCGLTPLEALQTATLNPALFFNIQNDYGSIAKNKIASLVLLKENPLENIANTKTIHAVVLRGRFVGDAELSELLARVRKMSGLN
jgi:imidazolonepropionase-like amidohydrolase